MACGFSSSEGLRPFAVSTSINQKTSPCPLLQEEGKAQKPRACGFQVQEARQKASSARFTCQPLGQNPSVTELCFDDLLHEALISSQLLFLGRLHECLTMHISLFHPFQKFETLSLRPLKFTYPLHFEFGLSTFFSASCSNGNLNVSGR